MLHLRLCFVALLSCCCNLVVVDALKGSSKHYDVLTSLSQPSRRRLQNNDKNNNNNIGNNNINNNNKNNNKDGTAAPTLSPPPSSRPSLTPSIAPSASPTTTPSFPPSPQPSVIPTLTPTTNPSQYPSNTPTLSPSIPPSALPSPLPSAHPSFSMVPSSEPTSTQSPTVSLAPSVVPSQSPRPSVAPSWQASEAPSASAAPSFDTATDQPSDAPMATGAPSVAPTRRSTVLPLRDFTLVLDDPHVNATSLLPVLQPYLYDGLRREAFPSLEDPYLSALYLQPVVVLDNGERRSVRRGLQSSSTNITLGGFVWFQGTNLPTLTELHNAQAQVLSLENTRLVATVQNELGVQITDVQLLEMDTTRDIPPTQNDTGDDDNANVGYIIGGIAGGILFALVGVMVYHHAVRSREPPLPDSPQTILPVDYNPAEDYRQVRSAIVEPEEAQPPPPPPLPSAAKPKDVAPQQQRAQPSASEQQPPGNTHLASATVNPPAVSKPEVENNPTRNEPVQSPVTLAAPAVLSTPLASTTAPVVHDNSDEHADRDDDNDNDEDSMAGFSLMTTPAPPEPTPQERSTVKKTNATATATKFYTPHSARTKYSKFSTPNVVENSDDDDDESQFTYAKIGDDSSMLYGSAQRSYVAGADELRLKSNLTSPSAAAASKPLMSGIAPTSPERNSLPTDERGQDDEQDLEGFARELESLKAGTHKTNNENVRNRPGGKEKQQRRQVKL